jgi:Na+/H+-dicarboxylate symporter
MAGLVMLAIILNALNLPLEGAGYVIAVDRILDMCRTTVNVWSDASGCVIIAKSEGETEVLTRWPPPEREDSLT